MSHPREILNRAKRQQARRDAAHLPRTPAPAPIAPVAPVAPVASSMSPPPPAPQPAPVPRPTGGHALYSELMRSHDRMGTRHLKH